MLFSDVWSENAALFERLMEIHSNPPILYFGFNTKPRWYRSYSMKNKRVLLQARFCFVLFYVWPKSSNLSFKYTCNSC